MTAPIEDFIREKLKLFQLIVPLTDFRDITVTVAREFRVPLEIAETLVDKLKGNLQLGMPMGEYEGQSTAVPFGRVGPGWQAEPKSSQNPLGQIELTSVKPPEKELIIVRVKSNPEAPWGAAYNGIIVNVNKDDTFDIRDADTGEIYLRQPSKLVVNPLAQGRKDIRDQRGDKSSDPWGKSDVGGDFKREYPNTQWMPSGQADKDVKNPKSLFKEANDKFYEYLFSNIVKEYGESAAYDAIKYLNKEIVNPSIELKAILRQYNLERLS